MIHSALERFLSEFPEKVIGDLLAKKFVDQGIRLSKRERKSIVDQLRRGTGELVLRQRWHWDWWRHRHVNIEVTPAEIEQWTNKANELIERLPELFRDSTDTLAESVLEHLRRKWKSESRAQRRDTVRFRRRHYRLWKKPLDLLRMSLMISREVGESITNDFRASSDAQSKAHLIEVMSRSHARGCQIAEEVICLLEAGFADGAMARWRSLHEVAVVASFIAEHGEELARRYVRHEVVESKRGAEEYGRCAPDLGFEPMNDSELQGIREAYDAALVEFGAAFKGDYGWAAEHLNKPRPNFADIERAAGVSYLRSFYRFASHNVHANPKGVFVKLGLLFGESQVLLAGASNDGLTDPGQCTALSLARLMTAYGGLYPTLDVCAALKIINDLVPEIAQAFGAVSEEWE